MTSRERVWRVLEGGRPDRVPFNFWMDRDAMASLDARWGHDFRITHYGADVVEAFVQLPWWSGLSAKTVVDEKTVWQIEPLVGSIEEALDLPLPDPSDPAVCADLVNKRDGYPDRAIWALLLAPLDILQPLRLAEGLYLDLLDHPDAIRKLLERIQPVLVEAARRACEQDIDVLYLAGDICSRDGAMLSPRHLREFLFDYLREVIDIAHRAGKKVFYHTDGRVTQILDLFVEYGIDGINPLEPRFHDPLTFVQRTQGKLILYGGLDNCGVIPNGTPEEVAAHVRAQFEALGGEGRLILSSHDIPSHCPQANLDAMVRAIMGCIY